jgi:putative DNA primase/helicase
MNLRGNGVWRDGSKAVVHMGDHLLVNMERKSLNDFESKYIYQQARKIEMPTVTLLQEEKQLLIDIANKIRWREKCSADILLSYILIAPLSAYWEWRPNVWQRGPAGAGKSTILEFFVKPCLGDMCISFEGDTTEAGIRQTIGTNAMAVIFDEPEADSYSGNQKIEQILKFIRSNASISTGVIAKGTSNQIGIQFQAQCMFLLASINSIPMKPQDKDRITCIELLGREGNTLEHWRQLECLLHALPKDIHQKIFYYMISNIDWAHKVIAQFKEFYFMRTGSRRTGDQFGPLSAGKYLLLGNGQEIPTMEEIEKLVDDSVWSLINENQQRTNEEDFINFIRDVELTIEDLNRNSKKRLLSEVVKIIKEDKAIGDFSTIEASKALQRKGMKVSKDRNTGKLRFHVSKNSDTFMSFFRQKPEFANYQVLLNRLPGATSGQARINDKNFATIHIPVELLITDEDKFGEPRTRPPVENHTVDIEWD